MTQTTPTCLWNDSATRTELLYAIEHGAVGATCNPVIVLDTLKKEPEQWGERMRALMDERPWAEEDEIGWAVVREISALRAKLLEDVFDREKGRNGRLSIQTDPRRYRDTKALIEQGMVFDGLARNMIVKVPATQAGLAAMEELTYRGVSINATVSFTVAQCVQVAEAVERALDRRTKEGQDNSRMGPVCTIMVGRLDDWLKVQAERQEITIEPGHLEWAGVAVFKRAYRIYKQRGYRLRLLSAAFRNHMHWSELIGGDVVISPPHRWQVRFNASDVTVMARMDRPVEECVVRELLQKFPDFERAYEEDGLSVDQFDRYAPTARTLRQFIEACHELAGQVRDVMIPNP